MPKTWDFFIAHAGSDKNSAEKLYELLITRSEVFLDSKCLLYGDDWPRKLPEAQVNSLITVVLISSNSDQAYYEQEEIAAAIEMARRDSDKHRVVPVYLEDRVTSVPYGLRAKHSIHVSELSSMDEVAQHLLNLLQRLRGKELTSTLLPVGQDTPHQRLQKPVISAKLFISYSHKDEKLLAKLMTHLSSLIRRGAIEVWCDNNIDPGEKWKREIDENLNDAHIILLLISPDFLDSDYCYEKEMPRAMERSESGEAAVISVILRPCVWEGTPFSGLQVLPTGGKPITTWRNQDEAFANVVEGIWSVVKKLLQRPDMKALHAMMEVSFSKSFAPWRLKQFGAYFVTRFRRAIVTVIATLAALAIVLAVALATFPRVIPEHLESYDNMEEDSLVEYLTEVEGFWRAPVNAQWKVGKIASFSNRIIVGSKIGLFKDEKTRNPYNMYTDFLLEFQVRVPKANIVAWVIRAKDFKNYYLFELEFPKDKQGDGFLRAYVYQNGKRSRDLTAQRVYVNLTNQYEPVTVKMKAMKGNFYVCVGSYMSDQPFTALDPIQDTYENEAYLYGGIGFAPQPEMEVGLAKLHITPDNSASQHPCSQN